MFKSKHKWGQHFLADEEILKKMVRLAEIKPLDEVVEIGAGTGNLTFFLAQTGARILALEKDRDLIARLQRRFKRFKNVKIIPQDARFFDYQKLGRYKLVANLPFNLTSFILRRLLSEKSVHPVYPVGLQIVVVMVQKEVGEKIAAAAGSSKRSLLTLLVEMVGKPEIVLEVPKEKFHPCPKVDSAVLKIIPQSPWNQNQEKLFRFIKQIFKNKRRQIVNNLASGLGIGKQTSYNIFKRSKINPELRPQDLNLKQWRELYAQVYASTQNSSPVPDRQRG